MGLPPLEAAGDDTPSSEEKSDGSRPSEPTRSLRCEHSAAPTFLDRTEKVQLRGKKRQLVTEAKADSGRYEELFSQANVLEGEALAALNGTENKRKKQCVRLALSLLKATREWLQEK